MKNPLRKIFCFISAAVLLFAFNYGQVLQTGSIRGTVTTPDGNPLPGVTVILEARRVVVKNLEILTNQNGGYIFWGVDPGLYKIIYKLKGQNTILEKAVKVEIGKVVVLDISLSLGHKEESVGIGGVGVNMDRNSTVKSTSMDFEYLQHIPATKNISTFLNMAPGINDGSSLGGTVRDNAYFLEAMNLNDPSIGTQGSFFSMDIVEEISVQVGGTPAQNGGKGANLRVVTKAGSNRLSGSISLYYTHHSFKSVNTKGTPLEGKIGGNRYEVEPGLTVGGPLAENKLFFLGNLSFSKLESFVNGYPLKRDLTGASEKSIAPDNFKPYIYFKLSWLNGNKDKFYFHFNYSDIRRNHRGASGFHTVEATRKQTNPTYNLSAQWTHLFNSGFIMNIKLHRTRFAFDLENKTNETPMYDIYTRKRWGNNPYTDLNRKNRTQINFDGTLFIENFGGAQEIVFGGEIMFSSSGRKIEYRSPMKDPVTGWGIYQFALYKGYPYYIDYDKPLNQKQRIDIYSVFINDTWNITRNLTLNLGARLIHQKGIVPEQGLEDGVGFLAPHIFGEQYPYDTRVQKEFTAIQWTDVSPRFSIIYDLFGDGTTLIKGSYNRYRGEVLGDYFDHMNPNQWLYYYGLPDDNWVVTKLYGLSSITVAKSGYGKHEVKSPYSNELVLGVERQISRDLAVSFRYLKKVYRRNVEDVGGNALDIDKLMNDGDLVWTNFEKVYVKDPHNGKEIFFWNRKELKPTDKYILNPPGADRTYTGYEITVNKSFAKNWFLSFSYLYSRIKGLIGTEYAKSSGISGLFDDPNQHINGSGHDNNSRDHVFKVAGILRLPLDINFGFFAQYSSGRRTTRTVSSASLGLALNQGNVSIYGDPKGSYKLPDSFNLDLRLEKVFRIGKFKFRGFVDIFNLFNEGKAIGVWTNSSSSGNGNPELWEMVSISAPRVFRLGAKFEF